MKKEMKVFLAIIAFTGLALSLSFQVFGPYFKEVYNVDAIQRGMIEFPRELPGVISVLLVAGLSFLGDFKLSIIAQLFCVIGIMFLGIVTPVFEVMLVFLFINSLGFHLFGTMRQSIGLAIAGNENIGRTIGRFNGLYTAFTMVGSGIAYIGFKVGFFDFSNDIKLPFVISAFLFLISIALLIYLSKLITLPKTKKRMNFVFRKEYKLYYSLVILFGVQEQIMLVYGPWVLIELLSKGADTISIIAFVGSFIGMFFIPYIGKITDKYGLRKVLFVDAFSFVFVYVSYGLLVTGFVTGKLPLTGLPVLLAYSLVIVDKMSTQMGMVRTVYLKSILVEESDITPTLSLGMSMDHVVSIIAAVAGGVVWVTMGPQYIFYVAALVSLFNIYIASRIK